MVSSTQWTWVWVNSGSWWWTGKPGVLQFMGLSRVGHDWATELHWIFHYIYTSYLPICWWTFGLFSNFLRNCHTVFHIRLYHIIFWSSRHRCSNSSTLLPIVDIFCSFDNGYPIGCEGASHSDFVISDIECLLTICILLWRNVYLDPLSILDSWLLLLSTV